MKASQIEKRDSGIALLGPLPWGTHFCQFYQTQSDMIDIVVPYFRAGLAGNELCVWVTSDFLTKKEALAEMEKSIPNFRSYWEMGQIEVFPHTDWYLQGGKFDLKRTMRMWMEKHDHALASGYAGLRVSGNPYWIDNKKDWDDFACYEAEINNVIGGMKLLVLCTYAIHKCGVTEILDVVKNHEFALAMNQGKWQIVNMPSSSFSARS